MTAGDLRYTLTRLVSLGVPGSSDSLAMLRGVDDQATVAWSRLQPVLLSASRPGRSPLIDELARLADVRFITERRCKRYVLQAIIELKAAAFSVDGRQANMATISAKVRELAANSMRGRLVAACAGPLRHALSVASIVTVVYLVTLALRAYISRAPRFETIRAEERRLVSLAATRSRQALANHVLEDLGTFPRTDPDAPLEDDMTFSQLRTYTRRTLLQHVATCQGQLDEQAPPSDAGIVLVTTMRAARGCIRAVELINFYAALPVTLCLILRVVLGVIWGGFVEPRIRQSREAVVRRLNRIKGTA